MNEEMNQTEQNQTEQEKTPLEQLDEYLTSQGYSFLQKQRIARALERGFSPEQMGEMMNPKMDWMRMDVILEGLRDGYDVNCYAKLCYSYEQMLNLLYGLRSGVDISVFSDPEWTPMQMQEIRYGLDKGLDVSFYAKKGYDDYQMKYLRLGAEANYPVDVYETPELDYAQMRECFEGFDSGLTRQQVTLYAKKEYPDTLMKEARECLQAGYDIAPYMNEQYNVDQIATLLEGVKGGYDVTILADPRYEFRQMCTILDCLYEDIPMEYIKTLANPDDPYDVMYEKMKTYIEERDGKELSEPKQD